MFGFCCDDVVVSGDNIVVGWGQMQRHPLVAALA